MKCPKCHFNNPETAAFCTSCGTSLVTPEDISISATKTIISPLSQGSFIAGKYRIIEKLGEGGMGVVYKAEDTSLDREVALKFLPPDLTRDSSAKERFIREAKAAAALSHPNICTIYEIDEADEKSFIAMEYIEGQTIQEKIKKGPLDLRETLDIAIQTAQGLKEAHKNGIIHRDIKPANIMLTEDGQAKVMDFGIAKRASGEDLTIPATILGTIAYMSPEQAKGKKVDHRTDLWSFGVVFYEMLSGKSPFKGGHEQATLHSILNEEPEPITDINTQFPQRIDDILKKCLNKDPATRYQNAEELIDDLRQLAQESGIEGISGQLITGYTKLKKTRFIYAASSVTVVCILAAVLGYIFLTSDKKEMLPEKPRLVVLPFENLGPAEDEYFAEGMTEEITSRLAKISALGVISRTTAVQYAGTEKTIQEIREELDVDFVLEGTVRWAKTPEGLGRVKITPQLIQTTDDTHIWADSFDHVFDDIFEIQSNIAQIVVEKLGITLLEAEQEVIVTRPTENIEAYQAFLRGRHQADHPHYTKENWEHVIQSFQQATDLDPEFGQAYAELAKAHARFYYLRSDLSQKRLQMAQAAANRALELSTDSPEVHLALSYYYLWAQRDSKQALEELERAEEFMPNNPDILYAKAIRFEVLGRFEEGIDILKKAHKLSPLDASIVNQLSGFYWLTRQYNKGIKAGNQSIELGPEEAWTYLFKIFNLWGLKGTTKESRAVVEAMPQEHIWTLWTWFWQEAGEKNFQAALERLSSDSSRKWIRLKTWSRPIEMFKAFAYDYLNEKQKAFSAYEKSKEMLEEELLKQPNDPRIHSSLGIAYAALGFKEKAIQEGKKAADLLPYSENPLYGICFIQDLALIYLLCEEYEAALDQIEFLLSVHSWFSIPWLNVNPYWKRMQNLPRYQDLINR